MPGIWPNIPGSLTLNATRRGSLNPVSNKQAWIVHLSADYPDPVEPFKTPVIKTLIDLTGSKFQHEVLSLNRRSPGATSFAGQLLRGVGRPIVRLTEQSFADGAAITYDAPGRGIYHATVLRRLGDKLADRFSAVPKPDLIVGHKLTIEGITARRMSAKLDVPYAISIQGDTDTKILDLRPDLAGELRRVFHEAAVVFPFTPWALQKIEEKLGKRNGDTVVLPCPTDLDQPLQPFVTGSKELISVFHLKNYKRKNLKGLAEAMRLLAQADPAIRLTIIGGGSEDDIARCKSMLIGIDNVSLAGPMSHDQLRQRFNAAAGFVLPSLRESFGLVFIEALFSGVPVIYPAGISIDGYFDDAPFALRVDAKSPARIADAMLRLVDQEGAAKKALGSWQISVQAQRFQRYCIGGSFSDGLTQAIRAGSTDRLPADA